MPPRSRISRAIEPAPSSEPSRPIRTARRTRAPRTPRLLDADAQRSEALPAAPRASARRSPETLETKAASATFRAAARTERAPEPARDGATPRAVSREEDDWFGDRDTEGERAAQASMAATVARIVGAKPFPVAARRLAELTEDDGAPLRQAIGVLESDPALSARVLQLVNGASFALRVRCTSVPHAAALLGGRRLHHLATTAAVLDRFDAATPAARGLVEHATTVGAFARYLAAHFGLPADDLFTAGFLHDIGKLMLLETHGQAYAELLAEYAGDADAVHVHERERWGFDHAQLGGHVLSAWQIPAPIPELVSWHHRPGRAYQSSPSIARELCCLRLADALAHAVSLGASARIPGIAQGSAAKYLEISEPQIATMWPDLAALHERCAQQLTSGDAAPVASVGPSLAPASLRDGSTPSAAPRQLACVVCEAPSFGTTCPACSGHVCPDHEVGPDHWCAACAGEYEAVHGATTLSANHGLYALALALALVGVAILAATTSGDGLLRGVAATALSAAILGLGYTISRRWLARSTFLRSRPDRRSGARVTRELRGSIVPELRDDEPAPAETPMTLLEVLDRAAAGSSANEWPAAWSEEPAVDHDTERAPPPDEPLMEAALPRAPRLPAELDLTTPCPPDRACTGDTQRGASCAPITKKRQRAA